MGAFPKMHRNLSSSLLKALLIQNLSWVKVYYLHLSHGVLPDYHTTAISYLLFRSLITLLLDLTWDQTISFHNFPTSRIRQSSLQTFCSSLFTEALRVRWPAKRKGRKGHRDRNKDQALAFLRADLTQGSLKPQPPVRSRFPRGAGPPGQLLDPQYGDSTWWQYD